MASSCASKDLDWVLGKIFSGRIVRHWNGLAMAVVESPFGEVEEKYVDMALWDMV